MEMTMRDHLVKDQIGALEDSAGSLAREIQAMSDTARVEGATAHAGLYQDVADAIYAAERRLADAYTIFLSGDEDVEALL
jgi:hypothetical protein